MLTDTFLTYGQSEPPADLIPLRAGPLTMLYDPTSGMVRRIKLREVEVLRSIYAAVRDRNWGTVPGVVRESVRTVEAESFHIEFESEHHQGDIHFNWRGLIQGDTDGTLRYEFDGKARTNFLRNRIGFCVLHPIRECTGARAKQIRVDGREVECRFPDLIEPQIFGRSSFQELCGVAHEITPKLWAQVEFEGDTFEMEDQRNWTDASFKTYCTPLVRPFPVEVATGTIIRQSVALRLTGDHSQYRQSRLEVVADPAEVLTLTIPGKPTGRLPQIGLGGASHGEPLTKVEIERLRQLRLSHLRVDVRLATSDWPTTLAKGASEAQQIGARLELALHLPRQGETDFSALTSALEPLTPLLVRILALREGEAATTPATLSEVRRHWSRLRVPIGGGSDCNFCEMNREQALDRFALSDSDFIFWSINPQVHAFDHLSVIETLEAQAATVRSARAFASNRPVVVSPVTLKQRFNPVATAAETRPVPGEFPPQADPRQLSHFAAAWTLGSVAALASAGVESVTFYETTGERGVMERASGPALHEKFPSVPGCAFPLFQVFAALAGFRSFAMGRASLPTLSALALFDAGALKRVLVANLGDQTRAVEIAGAVLAARRIQIKPYALAQLEYGG